MKHYIILTSGISNMGGAEMYTSNKLKFLDIANWSASVYFTNECQTIMLENLSKFQSNCIKECRKPFIYYSNKEIDAIVENAHSVLLRVISIYKE